MWIKLKKLYNSIFYQKYSFKSVELHEEKN